MLYFVHFGTTTGNERMRVMSDCSQTKGNTAILPVFWFFDKIESNKIKKKFQEQITVKKAINDGLTIVRRFLLDELIKKRKKIYI